MQRSAALSPRKTSPSVQAGAQTREPSHAAGPQASEAAQPLLSLHESAQKNPPGPSRQTDESSQPVV